MHLLLSLLVLCAGGAKVDAPPSVCNDTVILDDRLRQLDDAVREGEWLDASTIDDGQLLIVLQRYSKAWDERDVEAILDVLLLPHPRAQQLERECLAKMFDHVGILKWTRYVAIPDESNPQHFLVVVGGIFEINGECVETTWGIGHWMKLWGEWRKFDYVGKYPVLGSPCTELYPQGKPIDFGD